MPRTRARGPYDGRRVKIRSVHLVNPAHKGKNINPGWGGINIRFHPRRTQGPRYAADVYVSDTLHEVGHVHQAIFHHRKGLRLNTESCLANFEEEIIRHLGFGSPTVSEKSVWKDLRKGMKGAREKTYHIEHPYAKLAYDIRSMFTTKRALLRAVVRMYRDPKMKPIIEEMNRLRIDAKGPKFRKTHALLLKVLRYFQAYAKKYPQSPTQ